MKSSESGRSMIEMLGVLAIVGVLSVGGILGYTKAMSKYRTDKLLNEMAELTLNIRILYFTQRDYKDISVANLLKGGFVPHEMIEIANDGTEKIIHAFGGNVRVFPSLINGDQKHAFEIYAENLNREACVALSTLDWGQDPSSGFVAIYIGANNNAIDAPIMENINSPANSNPGAGIYTSGQHEDAIPIPPAKALAACACTTNECVIGLKYL